MLAVVMNHARVSFHAPGYAGYLAVQVHLWTCDDVCRKLAFVFVLANAGPRRQELNR
jgi:hypothetical protein